MGSSKDNFIHYFPHVQTDEITFSSNEKTGRGILVLLGQPGNFSAEFSVHE